MLVLQYMTSGIDTIGERVKQLRDRAGLSQGGLAQLVAREANETDYHQTAISAIERGTKRPSVQVLAALAKILNTNTDYLLGLTDDEKPASDLEDQVVVGVHDQEERRLLQETVDLLSGKSRDEQRYIVDLVRRLMGSTKPRIIGGE